MSYKALYRIYRPQIFDEIIGQKHIVQTLKNVIKQKKIGHAYLFAGPRGTGKTSLAHIFAREINKSIVGFKQDNDMDIIEIDAASNNGVEEVRKLIEGSKYAPSAGGFKVYIVDEVHMLTKGAWNALLKTLEEPPEHVIFILATTEPHRIPITILSRTQRFNFKRIESSLIAEQLKVIFAKENIESDEESIKFIAKLAYGGLRDALSIAEQVSAFSNGKINFEAVSQVFGLISISKQIEILNMAHDGKSTELMLLITRLIENGVELEKITHSFIDILRDYIIFKKTDEIKLVDFISEADLDQIKITLDFAYEAINNFIELQSKMKTWELPKNLFEMSMIKLSSYKENKATKLAQPVAPQTPLPSDTPTPSQTPNVVTPQPVVDQPKPQAKPVPISETSSLDIFETKEVSPVYQEETKEIFDTDPIEVNEFLTTETKVDFHKSSDDIKIGNSTEIKNIEDTNEMGQSKTINIKKLFEIEETQELHITQSIKSNYTINQIINILQHANKEIAKDVKDKWKMLNIYTQSTEFGESAKNLVDSHIISAGDDFILVSSELTSVIKFINARHKDNNFINLINNATGEKKIVYAISIDEFTEVKKQWQIMKVEDSFPDPQPLEKLQEVDDQNEFGKDMFGDAWKE